MNKGIKHLLAFVMAVLLVITAIPIGISTNAKAATNGHTQADAVAWASSKVGTVVGGSVECVAFAREYYSYLGYSVRGNGKDYENNVMDGWSRTYYYSGYVPQPGDIAVWRKTVYKNGTVNTYGHVAIVESANSSKMTILEQGASWGCVTRNSIGYGWYGELTCFIRPNFNTVVDTPNYANLGDDFYAYIIKMNSWKHLENSKTGNVQIAANGNDSNDPRQIWHFIRQSDNSYKISNEYNNECMDACNWGTEKGTNVGTMPDSGVTAQRWYIIQSGEGYKIKASYTDLCLDCSDNSDDPGTNIQLYTNYDTSAQLFIIYHLTKDGVNYSKPSAPSSTNVSVSVNYKNVTASWSSVLTNGLYDRREYDIRVYDENNNIIIEKFNVKSGYSFTLSKEGKYRVSVSVVNAKYSNYFTMTYSDWFTISEPLNTYTVSYNVNGGTGSIASQTKTHNTNLTLTMAKPTGKSFTVTYNANGGNASASNKLVKQTFTSWNTAANGSGKTYNAGAKYSANESVTLYAQYANPSIGSLPTPTRSGYSFEGWYTSATGGTKITDSTKVTANITIYAHWTKNSETKAVVKDVKINHNVTVNYKSTYMLSPEITADKGAKYTVKYESSDTKVATVDKDGKIYGAKKGSATITCTVTDSYGNAVTDKCNVNVGYSGVQWVIIILLFGWIWYI